MSDLALFFAGFVAGGCIVAVAIRCWPKPCRAVAVSDDGRAVICALRKGHEGWHECGNQVFQRACERDV